MAPEHLATDVEIAKFDARHSPFGLLGRYARSRLRQLPARLFMIGLGAFLVGLLISPALGVVTLAVALVGECIDVLMLVQVRRRSAQEDEYGLLHLLTSASAAIQAASIGACFALTFSARPDPEVSFFVFFFVFGAAIGDGMLMAYHRTAVLVRLSVHALTLGAFFVIETWQSGPFSEELGFQLVGTLVLGYVVWSCVRGFDRATRRGFAARGDLLLRQREIEQTGIDLKATQAENRRLALVARHANDSVVVSRVDGPIVWVNAAFTQTTGYTSEDAVGRTIGELLNGPDTNPKTIARITESIQTFTPIRTEILNYTKSGETVWMETNIVPVTEEDGSAQIVIAVERNISAARRQMDELAKATLEAQKRAKERANFLATMSHEIRTPLNGILGMAEVLELDELGAEQKEQVQTIRTSAEALLVVINDVLDLSRLEREKMPIVSEPFSVSACVKSSVQLLRPLALEKGLTLDLSFDGPVSTRVDGDKGRLRQILLNLIGNAIKFTHSGGVNVSVSGRRTRVGLELDIEVSDTGIGIAPEQAEAIFELYAQASDQISKDFGGTGLGLAISRKLARKMGGDLVLKTKADPGALFALSLPFAFAGSSPESLQEKPVQEQSEPAVLPSGLRILVADDNATNRMVLDRYLDGTGSEVFFATDGAEAVQSALEHVPHVILMDMQMPVMGGTDATRHIRAADIPQPYIVAITGGTLPNERDACLEAGMDCYLTKPVGRAALFHALRHVKPDQKPLGRSRALRVSG